MLTSLLPGLREVRTPLAIGYLWLVVGWLIWGELVPLTRPPGDGLVPRIFELGTLLGSAVVLAALSFVAYAVGAVLTFPVEGGLAGTLLRRLAPETRDRGSTDSSEGATMRRTRLQRIFSSRDELETRREFQTLLGDLDERARSVTEQLGEPSDLRIAEPPASELRIRLLVASTELYGEYDRLTAEASFRINVVAPLCAAVVAVSYRTTNAWFLLLLLPAVVLAIQGVNRLRSARLVLWRSVTTGKVELPAQTTVARWEEELHRRRTDPQ